MIWVSWEIRVGHVVSLDLLVMEKSSRTSQIKDDNTSVTVIWKRRAFFPVHMKDFALNEFGKIAWKTEVAN